MKDEEQVRPPGKIYDFNRTHDNNILMISLNLLRNCRAAAIL